MVSAMGAHRWLESRLMIVAVFVTALALASVALAAATHEEYVAQVNPICKQAAHQAKKLREKTPSTGNRFTDFLLATQRFGKLLGRTTHRIAAVPPAPVDEVAVRRWIKGLRQQKRLIDRYLSAINHGNVRAARSAARKTPRVAGRNQKLAARLGLRACARGTRGTSQ
jgi:hypothetical protein